MSRDEVRNQILREKQERERKAQVERNYKLYKSGLIDEHGNPTQKQSQSNGETQMSSGSDNLWGLVQQWIGSLIILWCLVNAFLLDGLTVYNAAAGGRVFNLSLGYQNLLLFLVGAFLSLYGRLLRMR